MNRFSRNVKDQTWYFFTQGWNEKVRGWQKVSNRSVPSMGGLHAGPAAGDHTIQDSSPPDDVFSRRCWKIFGGGAWRPNREMTASCRSTSSQSRAVSSCGRLRNICRTRRVKEQPSRPSQITSGSLRRQRSHFSSMCSRVTSLPSLPRRRTRGSRLSPRRRMSSPR